MLRKFSASGLALVMIVIIALRVPALGFCLCDQHLILNDGSCCPPPSTPVPAAECNECGQCEEESSPTFPVPCDDCVVVLNLDPGDFLWSNHQFSPAPEIGTPILLPVGLQDDARPSSQASYSALQIRGSPFPALPLAALPRLQVLRL